MASFLAACLSLVAQATVHQDSVSWSKTVVRDLTGDGRLDTVVVRVIGHPLEAGSAVMQVRANGQVILRRRWAPGSYLGPDMSLPFRKPPLREPWLRDQLERSVQIVPIDSIVVGHPPVDSAVVERLRRRTRVALSLYHGYESEEILAWDPERHRWVLLWGCC
jgi:hypothetical protein